MTLPRPIVNKRKNACGNCSCDIDFENPCAECPNKRWGKELCFIKTEDQLLTQKTKNFPPIGTMLKTFAGALKNEAGAILSGSPRISEEQAIERMNICKQCEFFVQNSQRCRKCGCFLQAKVLFRSQSCPIGKWGPEPKPTGE